ncbi:MAG: TetR/AcrR family transcriptional regulator [Clostridia bacterium]|nr:TetR/AcrR family transcriptional regulator [Clostridia bacterium]
MDIRHKPAFDRADPEKKQRVLETGIQEFAELGYEKANINIIAKKAGISIGLMYKYFETKEDFFVTCMDEAIDLMEDTIARIVNSDGPVIDRMKQLLLAVKETSSGYVQFVRLYQVVTNLPADMHPEYFADRIESISYSAYSTILREAQETGEVRGDCNTRAMAFFFDSILRMLQFSSTHDYYRRRLQVYCGDDILSDSDPLLQEIGKLFDSAFFVSHDDVIKIADR